MDKRVVTIKPNYFFVDCDKFLNREIFKEKTNADVYRYVFNNYKMLGFEPTFEDGKDEVIFSVLYAAGDSTHCRHCYKGTRKTLHIPGEKKLGTVDATVNSVEITLLR